MVWKELSSAFWASPQVGEADLIAAAEAGVRSVISSRPDGEQPGQPSATETAAIAARHGLAFVHIPVTMGAIGASDVARTRQALADLPSPILGFCRSGTRAAAMWALARAGEDDRDEILRVATAAGFDLSPIADRLPKSPRTPRRCSMS